MRRAGIGTPLRTWSTRWIAVAFGLSASQCSGELPSPAVVDKLRLLVITADHPEVGVVPGTTNAASGVSVEAWWDDGSSRSGRDVYFLWRLCPEGADREPRSCLQPDRGTDLALDRASIGGTQPLHIDASRLPFAPVQSTDTITTYFVFVAMCPVSPPVYDSGLGQYVCPSEADVPNELREGIQAFRRIVVRNTSDPAALNHNPTIASISVGGHVVPAEGVVSAPRCPAQSDGTASPDCGGVSLVLIPTPDSTELLADGTSRESLLVSFYVSAGSVDRPRAVVTDVDPTGVNGSLSLRWFPPTTPGPQRVWAVLRDGRGGDVAQQFTVQVE